MIFTPRHTVCGSSLVLNFLLSRSVYALGEPCKISNNRLDPNTHKFLSDCGPTEYCATASLLASVGNATTSHNATSASPPEGVGEINLVNLPYHKAGIKRSLHGHVAIKRGQQSVFLADGRGNTTHATVPANTTSTATETCQPKGCRRDEFPFGYGQFDILPPRCALDQFCPDEEDECRPLVELGGACQLNRDDECLPPANASLLASEGNFSGSICLSYTCMYADVDLGNDCKIDNTVYTGYLPDGSQFTDIVSRDNCATGMYCSSDSLRCELRLGTGRPCSADSQCLSGNCDVNDICVAPPETPSPVPKAAYALVPLGTLAFVGGMVASLWLCHQKARKRRAKAMQEYWTEQMAYRESILSMHKAAEKEQKRETGTKEYDSDGFSVLSGTTFTSSSDVATSETSSDDRYRQARRDRARGQSTGNVRYAR